MKKEEIQNRELALIAAKIGDLATKC